MKIKLNPRNSDDRLRLVGVAIGYMIAAAFVALAFAGVIGAAKLLIKVMLS